MNEKRKLFIIGKVWPEPNSSAAGTRMMQLIDFFQKENFEITFASTAKMTEFQEDLEQYNIRQEQVLLNDESFDQLLEELEPDVVIFDRFLTEEQFGWRVIEKCPDAYRILNTEDLHFLRRSRHQSVKEFGDLSKVELFTDDAVREISSIYRCDLTLLVSEYELRLLSSEFQVPEDLLHYLPVFSEQLQAVSSFEERQGFMFIGNYYHEPNWDALKFLKKDIWPLIKSELPGAQLHIYGAYPGQKVMDFHNEKEGFLVHGRADDAIAVTMKCKLSLVPLRFGAGIKGKLLEAMKTGTPSVTSSVGAEGMIDDQEWGGVVANDITEFVLGAVELYRNRDLWSDAQKRGFDILKCKFNEKDFLPDFKLKLDSITKERSKNKYFIQKLVQHQSLMSNRYLSKWIELKNKV